MPVTTGVAGAHACASDDPPRPARVLVVDDEDETRASLQRLLATQFIVEAYANGSSALAGARERRPDLVLSDVVRLQMDGLALVRALREDPVTRGIPVFLLSAQSGEEAAVTGLEAGADDYLVKPFGERELLARVSGQIRLARLRNELASAEERRRLAAGLHDSLSQTLVGAAMLAGSLATTYQKRPQELVPAIQESLQNVMLHAAATEVAIRMTSTPAAVTLRIRDNGRGFDPKAASAGHGQQAMRDRAAMIGARLRVGSTLGGGTQVFLRWPRPAALETLPGGGPQAG